MKTVFSIFFEDPFWVGVFETRDGAELTVGRVVFGGEPSDAEVRGLLLHEYDRIRFYTSRLDETAAERPGPERLNPKRSQRRARKDQRGTASTKAQEALKRAYEERKTENLDRTRHSREEKEELKFLLKQEKKKRKKRGH